MTYTVKYKKVGGLFWSTLKNVKGDGLIEGMGASRWFILSDETRVEIPILNTEFRFPPARFMAIKKRMESEAGQSIPTRDGA